MGSHEFLVYDYSKIPNWSVPTNELTREQLDRLIIDMDRLHKDTDRERKLKKSLSKGDNDE
jgi:hypothetical protein